jgi:putative two-component system response regulator
MGKVAPADLSDPQELVTRAAEYREADIGPHIRRISYNTRDLAGILGLDAEFGEMLFFARPMHDVGKIGIPDNILFKPGGLTAGERAVMERHAVMGARILGHSKSPYVRMGAEIALNHHERWDGGGYPNGARGEAIPLTARIMQIGDVYDALRSRRPYKPPLDHLTALGVITRGDGRTLPGHFDPAVLAAFTQNHEEFREVFEQHSEEDAEGDFHHLSAERALDPS